MCRVFLSLSLTGICRYLPTGENKNFLKKNLGGGWLYLTYQMCFIRVLIIHAVLVLYKSKREKEESRDWQS